MIRNIGYFHFNIGEKRYDCYFDVQSISASQLLGKAERAKHTFLQKLALKWVWKVSKMIAVEMHFNSFQVCVFRFIKKSLRKKKIFQDRGFYSVIQHWLHIFAVALGRQT